MNTLKPSLLFGLLAALILPATALAHNAVVGGFSAGFLHPVLGTDHLLAMVGVGVVSAQMGGRAIWTVPASFVAAMIVGGLAGMNTPPALWQSFNVVFIMELGITLSVILLGAAIALRRNVPEFITMTIVAVFGLFHGYAHGLEIPALATSWAYIGGFVLATAGLHVAGVAIGVSSPRIPHGATVLRYAGAVVAGMGLQMLALMFGF